MLFVRYLYPLAAILLLLISATSFAQASNDTTIYTQLSLSPLPADSASQRIFIAYNCNSSSPAKNAENSVQDCFDEIMCHSWTYSVINCQTGTLRSFQDFPGLSAIPAKAVVDSAIMELTGKKLPFQSNSFGNSYFPGSQYNSFGTNEVLVGRVLQSWSSSTITWNNSPAISFRHSDTIPPSTSKDQYDATINVTQLVKDMRDSSTFYGFVFKLNKESHYRSMTFYSSYADSAQHRPKLNVYYHYDSTVSVKDVNAASVQLLHLYPNPAAKQLNVQYSITGVADVDYAIYNMQGQELLSASLVSGSGLNIIKVDIEQLAPGAYIFSFNSNGQKQLKRFTKL